MPIPAKKQKTTPEAPGTPSTGGTEATVNVEALNQQIQDMSDQAATDKAAYEKLESELNDANAKVEELEGKLENVEVAGPSDEGAAKKIVELKAKLKASQDETRRQRNLRVQQANKHASVAGTI